MQSKEKGKAASVSVSTAGETLPFSIRIEAIKHDAV